MHLLEAYALTAGCKVNHPHVHLEEIELPKDKYITFHGFSPKGPSKQYNKWEMVLRMLSLDKDFDHNIIQIGGSDDAKYEYANHDYLGATNYHSLAYLIKNAELHLGFDSLPVHLASAFNRKIVAIYPWYAQNCGPYFSEPEDVVILEPDFSVFKPCFNVVDRFDLINTIEVSDIYQSVINLLSKE